MLRKDFIKSCGFACLGGTLSAILLEGCASHKSIAGQLHDEYIELPLTEFEVGNGRQKQYKKYLIVNNSALQYPIAVFRLSADDYSALWMSCTSRCGASNFWRQAGMPCTWQYVRQSRSC